MLLFIIYCILHLTFGIWGAVHFHLRWEKGLSYGWAAISLACPPFYWFAWFLLRNFKL